MQVLRAGTPLHSPAPQGPTLTHKAGDKHARHTLLPNLLDLGLVARCNGRAHDGQRVHVGDRAHGGSREPGQPKKPTEATQGANEKQIKVEAGALE